jgi:dCMP deaminase
MINPHKTKYFPLYWSMVEAAAAQSVATRHKVGAIVVTPTGMISVGWNGTPAGMDNNCESHLVEDENNPGKVRWKTNPVTLHAERNAIDKMTRQGVPTQGSILFVSRAPCFECAKALHGLGLRAIYYREQHDDMRGVEMLRDTGTPVIQHVTMSEPAPPTNPHTDQYSLMA